MALIIDTPPTLKGTNEQQLQQLTRYLFHMSEVLNIALNDVEQVSIETSNALPLSGSGSEKANKSNPYSQLKELIINTADIINSSIDVVRHTMNSQYEAISDDYGTFKADFERNVKETAEATIDEYNYTEQITNLQNGLNDYISSTSGYIKSGFIDTDGDGTPILGIAIGQDLRWTETEQGSQLDASQACAFYTASRVSFRLGGIEVAYVSNDRLYIGNATIAGNLSIADKWEIKHANGGLVCLWKGGAE